MFDRDITIRNITTFQYKVEFELSTGVRILMVTNTIYTARSILIDKLVDIILLQ